MSKCLSLTSLLFATLAYNTILSNAKAPYCLAGDSCFPSDDEISSLNETIGGRLIKSTPYGAACYGDSFNADACKDLVTMKNDVFYRQALPAGVMYTNWELDDDNKGCPVPDEAPESALDGECTLGGLPAYVVNATSADDVASAVKFASEHNLRFRIKNSGHDYTGRSSGPGALSVWMRYMNDAQLVNDFKICDATEGQDVLSAGPGVDVEELFEWGANNGKVTIGGFTTTVGATGGYVLGGGTGPLGSIFGLGVDNVVQFEVVTADGEKRTVNSCENSDLFWALRGGGGAFAAVTRVYLKTYPAFTAVNTISGAFVCDGTESYAKLIKGLVDLQLPMRDYGFTGIWEASFPNIAFLSTLPFINDTTVSAEESYQIMNPVLNIEGVTPALKYAQYKTWNEAYQEVVWPTVKDGSKVGVNLADFSRLISYDMVSTQEGRDKLSDYIVNLPVSEPFLWENVVGEATRKINAEDTAVHPEWRKAFGFMNIPTFGPWSGVTAEMNATALAVLQNATEIFGTATYYNEDYILESNWQDSMFGSNYDRLLAIKKEVDPDGLFNCRQCVGSEDGF